jgi:hypothetical protein
MLCLYFYQVKSCVCEPWVENKGLFNGARQCDLRLEAKTRKVSRGIFYGFAISSLFSTLKLMAIFKAHLKMRET